MLLYITLCNVAEITEQQRFETRHAISLQLEASLV